MLTAAARAGGDVSPEYAEIRLYSGISHRTVRLGFPVLTDNRQLHPSRP